MQKTEFVYCNTIPSMKYIILSVISCIVLLLTACHKSQHTSSSYTRSYRGYYSITFRSKTYTDTIRSTSNTDYAIFTQIDQIGGQSFNRRYVRLYSLLDSSFIFEFTASKITDGKSTGIYAIGKGTSAPYMVYGSCTIVSYDNNALVWNNATYDTTSSWVQIDSYKENTVREIKGSFKVILTSPLTIRPDTAYGTFDVYK